MDKVCRAIGFADMKCVQQAQIGPGSQFKNDQTRSICHLILDKNVIPTEIISHRPFQGWRYLNKNIPNDLILANKNSRKIYLILKELCLV